MALPFSLPEKFENIVSNETDNELIVRSNLKNIIEIAEWVKEFGVLNNTKWNSRDSIPRGKQMCCAKTYICQHSAFMKPSRDQNKNSVSKNALCLAKIHCKIKLRTANTMRKDPYIKDGLCAVIKISKKHSHSTKSAQSLRYLQDNTKKDTFFEYFFNGLAPSESKRFHEAVLESEELLETDLSNTRINPSLRTINYWYDEWRSLNLGPRTGEGMIKKLEEKISEYEDKGITVVFDTNPFCVGIFTPIMKRVHGLTSSKEIVFCDTTSSCDTQQHSVTFVLTACPCGAAPLGVLISRGQSMEAYSAAFKLLKNNVTNSFCNQGYPDVFLTDNSKAEIEALKNIWPESEHLLCIFHILQAVWRWLWDSKNEIPHDRRQILMKKFQNLLYCEDLTVIEELFDECKVAGADLPQWLQYMEFYHSFKEKWILAYRNSTTRGNHTNNFSEVSVRIFKDIVLSRVKAYNVIALVDFVCTVLESFYKSKLRAFCNFQNRSALLFFKSCLQKTNYIKEEDIVRIDEDIFLVPSEKDTSNLYTVNIKSGSCTCHNGKFGKFCKHQCAVYQFFDCARNHFPAITQSDRYMMACVAFDKNRCPSRDFYANFHTEDNEDDLEIAEIFTEEQADLSEKAQNSIDPTNELLQQEVSGTLSPNNIERSGCEVQDLSELESLTSTACNVLHEKVKTLGSTATAENLKTFIRRIKKISSEGHLETFLASSSAFHKKNPKHGTIRVQPTSISRRKPGITRGCKRLAAGRKAVGDNAPGKKKRKVHSIRKNVMANIGS